MKVAVIEDDRGIINAVQVAFEFRWPDVQLVCAMSGQEGVELVKRESPDVLILDINLPDISGFEVLKKVREFSALPVIILTVRADDNDVLKGLESGADDYVTKPFNYLTLLARVKAVLRRTNRAEIQVDHNTAVNARLNIDFVNQKVRIDNRLVKLTPVEYQFLLLLVKRKNQVVTHKDILSEVWSKDDWQDTENIRIYIRRLRKKLGDIPPQMILSQRGEGYMLKA
jgi:two-component system, OmpR family, KDP operon response regulator KdpE